MRRNPALKVLFVEPPADIVFDLCSRRMPTLPRLRALSADGRLRAFRPLKPAPRRLGPLVDRFLVSQLRQVARALGFSRPTLWINDVTYVPLIAQTRWPALYDVTDDWLLAPFPRREYERLRRLDELALRMADQVVVCSRGLAETRGQTREVVVIPNGVDVEHFRRPRPRPDDLPPPPVAVYVGSLHEARIDVELVAEAATTLPHLRIVLVGPDSLTDQSRRSLARLPNVALLGPRPYRDVPGYLQHADVIIVPHRISPFTDSLDPIKSYECLAVTTPSVATPVAGFRELRGVVTVVSRGNFVDAVRSTLSGTCSAKPTAEPRRWEDAAKELESVVVGLRRRRYNG